MLISSPKKRTKKKQVPKTHTEIKGLLFLGLSIVCLLSLISYSEQSPKDNFLGAIGYFLAIAHLYLFGLGSYLIVGYTSFLGFKFLTNSLTSAKRKTYIFSFALISFCFLATILAESSKPKAELVENKVYTEQTTLFSPHPTLIKRYNLGGVPFYYLYHDVPYFNLQKLLSPIGASIIFLFAFIISFLLLTGIKPTEALFFLYRTTIYCLRKLFFSSFYLLKKSFYLIRLFDLRMNLEKIKKVSPKRKITLPPLQKETPVQEEKSDFKIHTMKDPVLFSKKEERASFSKLKSKKYSLPSPRFLTNPRPIDHPTLKRDLDKQAKVLEETLKSFGIQAKVTEINCGPSITSFEVQPPIGVKVQKIKALENDIALNMQAKSIRILAPIPGKAVVGVEVPAVQPQEVSFKEMLIEYQRKKRKLHIPIVMGKTVNGEYVISDLVKMPHCLIAGATGSGKSVCINTIVMSILMTARPDEIKLMMIDPKKVELTQYSNLPHMIAPVISEPHGAYAALQWLVREMKLRYEILKHLGLRNIASFNSRKIRKDFEESLSIEIPEHMPYFVCIIDEFADLMMVSSSDLETPIARIAQMARAVGIHLILATQRPSREVITGIIKANFPTRIAFKVSSRINSQIILDETGAESLLGNGDLLFLPPGSSNLVRAQGAYISDTDINRIVGAICEELPPNYLISSFDAMRKSEDSSSKSSKDALYEQALDIVLSAKSASTTFLQRKLKIGYARAAGLMDELEENGIVGPQEGARPRKIIKRADLL